MTNDEIETRQERREKKLQRQRERMAMHGKNLARIYMNAIMRRISIKGLRKKKK